ncbi:MAG: hypothetical protein O2821_12745 [Chloroflexi bacterium]|nr:hypothetical protein [Chloroflexota bacterium]
MNLHQGEIIGQALRDMDRHADNLVTCQICGGVVADDQTPSWVFKAETLCDCEEDV